LQQKKYHYNIPKSPVATLKKNASDPHPCATYFVGAAAIVLLSGGYVKSAVARGKKGGVSTGGEVVGERVVA
jgi:hypothetical protein